MLLKSPLVGTTVGGADDVELVDDDDVVVRDEDLLVIDTEDLLVIGSEVDFEVECDVGITTGDDEEGDVVGFDDCALVEHDPSD